MAEKYSSVKPATKVALFSSLILASFVVSQQGALAEETTGTPEGGTVSAVTNANPNPTASATSENSSSSEAVTEEAPANETPASTTDAPTENTLEVDPTTLPKSLVGQEFTNAEEVRLDNIQLDSSKKRHELTEAETSKVKETSSGTIYLEYAGQPASGQNFYNLFSLSSTTQNNEYTNIYINNGVAGIESRLQSNSGTDRVLRLNSGGYRANNGEWNALAVTYNQNENSSLAVNLYLNGELVGTGTASQDIFGNGLDKAQLGETKRGTQNVWAPGSLSVNNFTVYNRALTAEEIAKRSALFVRRDYPLIKEEGSEITEKITVFEGGRSGQKNPENGVASFRIPALLKTDKGTLIAATDQRHDHYSDWGNIAQVVKRSTDQGTTWGQTIKIVDLRENPRARDKNQGTPLTIDTALVQDPTTKRIFAIYDMYPEGRALFGAPDTYEAEYTVVEGKHYLNLYKTGETAPYLLKEDGRVYTPAGEATEYRVNMQDTSAAYANIGDIYQGTGTEPIGNIYFQTQKTAPFRTALANFIWMSYSDDDGVTWSHPKDITPNLKKPHMKFLGLGPGTGIVLHTGEHAGRLVVPAYSLSYTGGMNSQSALVFYSDDHGETWHAGKSFNDGRRLANGTVLESSTMNNGSEIGTEATIVQLNNGQIKMFMRGKKGAVRMATSTDGGASWINEVELFQEVPDVYVQLSAIRIERDGKEFILLANASGPGRTNGHVRIAEVQADGSLVWNHHQMVQDGEFAYNSIQHLGGDDFGLLYEHKTGDQNWYSLYYKKFNWNYLTQETPGRPQSSVTSVDFYENNYIGLNFENDILALNNPSLRLSNGNVAEFVSQLDSKRLLYRITDADKGAAILDVASGSLTNINKLPVSIATLLTKDGDKYLSKVNGRTVKISGEDVYEDGRGFGLANLMDGNKSTVSELRWETANNPAITLPQTITLRLKNEKDLHSLLITKRTPGNGTMTKYQVKAYLGDQQVFDTGEKSVAFATADIPVLFNGVRADKIEFIPIEAHTNPTTKNNTMWTVREVQLFELLPTPIETYTDDVELKDQATNLRVQLETGESKAIVGLRVTHKESGTADTPESLLGQDYDLYDISLVDDKGQSVAPTRETLVIVPIDEGKEVEKVLYLSDQASEVEFTETTASDETGKSFKSVVFVAPSFSEYAIVYREVRAHGEGVKAPVLPEGETPVVEPEKVEEPEAITSKGEGVKAEALPSFDIDAWLKENSQSETEVALETAKGESVTADELPTFDIDAWLKENAQTETEPEMITAKGESTKAEALPSFDIDAWLKENAQSETEPELITAKGESTKAEALPSFDIEAWLAEQAPKDKGADAKSNNAKGETGKKLPDTGATTGIGLSVLGLLSLVGLGAGKGRRQRKE
ncbi:LPXTG cell wall anchor domain-containing protein [Streptococcus suis]|nr:LPXTG cell wall anchor domain-containing protein [Streptococcus suis]NQJ77697.1 LPXTG cell wall anchor domain-containing protein [Streptococcus suis]